MRRYFYALLTLLTLLLSASAQAGVTWESTKLVSKLISTTGTETASPPTTDPCARTSSDHGLCLRGINAFEVHIEAAAAMTAGTLQCWIWNPASGQWNRAPQLDITTTTLQDETYSGFTATGGNGGVAFVPNGIVQASDIYIIGTRRP